MAATTMRSIVSTRNKIIAAYPQFSFRTDDLARWSPDEQTIYYVDKPDLKNLLQLIHELGHALLGHTSYRQDIELIHMERDAWEAACVIAEHYALPLDEDFIESSLDSYREWLHSRSRCTNCQSAGLQSFDSTYHCPLCKTKWHTNDARQCGLKRYQLQK